MNLYNEYHWIYRTLSACYRPPNAHQRTPAPAAPSLRAAALHARASMKRSSGSNPLVNDEMEINLLPATEMISCALQDVTWDTIHNCFRHARLCQEGAEVASAVQADSNIVTLWEELADTLDGLSEKVAFKEFWRLTMMLLWQWAHWILKLLLMWWRLVPVPSPSSDVAKSPFC